MVRWTVVGYVTIALLGAGACSGGSLGSPNGVDGATGDGAGTGTFPCGDFQCRKELQYCFRAQNNGLDTIPPECRPMPPGCSVCACAEPDAASLSTNPVCTASELTCTDGMVLIDANTSTPTLHIGCIGA